MRCSTIMNAHRISNFHCLKQLLEVVEIITHSTELYQMTRYTTISPTLLVVVTVITVKDRIEGNHPHPPLKYMNTLIRPSQVWLDI